MSIDGLHEPDESEIDTSEIQEIPMPSDLNEEGDEDTEGTVERKDPFSGIEFRPGNA